MSFPPRQHFYYLFACSSASHLFGGLLAHHLRVSVFSPPQQTTQATPNPPFSTTPHFSHVPGTNLSPYTMSNSKLVPVISPTLTDHSRTNLVPWKVAINRAARGVFSEWNTFGFLFSMCDNALWALLNTPLGKCCGTDQQTSRNRLPLPSTLTLLPETLSNAPWRSGQPVWHVQPLSMWPSLRA